MLVVMGTFRVAPEHIEALLPLARTVAEATRAEQGCIQYSYAQDIDDPALFHVAERWTDRAGAHGRMGRRPRRARLPRPGDPALRNGRGRADLSSPASWWP